jgi:fructose-1-phosphate kinase PfkB-like protein
MADVETAVVEAIGCGATLVAGICIGCWGGCWPVVRSAALATGCPDIVMISHQPPSENAKTLQTNAQEYVASGISHNLNESL